MIATDNWSAPKAITTRAGLRTVRTQPLTEGHDAWAAWRLDKQKVKDLRFSIGKAYTGTGWELTHWQNVEGQFEEDVRALNDLIGIAAIDEHKAKEAMKIDYVADHYEPLRTAAAAKLYDWQKPSCQRIIHALKNGNALDASQTGCHARGTMILMHDGTTKPVESIHRGDYVMGWDSTPRRVMETHRGRQEMARITPVKGTPFTVNTGHILTLECTNTGIAYRNPPPAIVDVSVNKWMTWMKSRKHFYKLFRCGVDCWPERDLTIDPYYLGAMLGDGCMVSKDALSLSKPDPEMLILAEEIAAAHGATISTAHRAANNPTHHFRQAKDLWQKLQSLGLAGLKSESKFIPAKYKASSREQREKMLAGLLDTDGHRGMNGGYDYISASRTLSEDVAFIARSLGLAAYVNQCTKGCQNGFTGTYWRVGISGDTTSLPIRIERKKSAPRTQKKSVLRTGFKVTILPEDEYFGFTIEGDGRYLMGDFTVTHNSGKTYIALAACAELGFTPYVIAPLAVLESWRRASEFMGVPLGGVTNYDKARAGSSPFIAKNKDADRRKGQRTFAFRPQPPRSGLFDAAPPENFKPLLIIDECQRIKGGDKTSQGKLLIDAVLQGTKILCISATAAKDPTEMHGVGIALGLHEGGPSFTEWMRRHGCRPGAGGYYFTSNTKAAAEIMQRVHRSIFPAKGTRIRSTDVPNYPENAVTAHLIDNAEIVTAYRQMKDNLDMIAMKAAANEMDKRSAKASGLAEIMKARRASEIGKLEFIIEETREMVADGFQVAVFLNFREHLAIVRDGLKLKSQPVWGTSWIGKREGRDEYGNLKWIDIDGPAQKPEERTIIIDDFQNGKQKVVLVSLQAGGAGISLHDVNGIAPRQSLVSPSYSMIDLVQSLGRIWRAGSHSKATQRILFASQTIEEEIASSIQAKCENLERLNDHDLMPDSVAKVIAEVTE